MKADFNVMKDISKYTRVGPQERCTTLNTFMSTINEYVQPDMLPDNCDYIIAISIEARVCKQGVWLTFQCD